MLLCTTDSSRLRSLSQPLSIEEIRSAKAHIKRKGAVAAVGIDGVNRWETLAIPDEELLKLFNHYLDTNEIPRVWLMSLLAAVPKKYWDLALPDSYRVISLQSCLLKFLLSQTM